MRPPKLYRRWLWQKDQRRSTNAGKTSSSAISAAHLKGWHQSGLGIDEGLPGGLWRFVRADQPFSELRQPWNHENTRQVAALAGDMMEQDFIGMKLGDVNGSWAPLDAVAQQSVAGQSGASQDSTGSTGLKAEINGGMLEPRSVTAPDGVVSQKVVRLQIGLAGLGRWHGNGVDGRTA